MSDVNRTGRARAPRGLSRRLCATSVLAFVNCAAFTGCAGSVGSDDDRVADGAAPNVPVSDAGPGAIPGVGSPDSEDEAPTQPPGHPPSTGATQPGSNSGNPANPTTPGATTPANDPNAPATNGEQAGLRRLSNREYNNTVRDLLGTTLTPADNFLKETAHGFDNIAGSLGMTAAQYNAYLGAAADLASAVFADATLRAPFETCGTDEPDGACLSQVITDFGLRAFRRPLDADEVQTYRDVYDRAREQTLSPMDSLEQVVRAILSSSEFLYRIEFDTGEPGTLHRVSDYELASRLSYFLWNTMPDATLLDAATANGLGTDAEVLEQVERLLVADRANALVDSFAWQWLGMEVLESHAVLSDTFPNWDEPLREGMLGEARAYLSHFVRGDVTWKDFLTADLHYVNPRLAAHYGAPNDLASDPQSFVSYDGDTQDRLGFLGTAGFLTVSSFAHRTSPTLRAKWILESLLCAPPPPPPPELMIADLDADEIANQAANIANVRERLELHRTDPNCASCHSYLDPLGLALENFDAIGRHRDTYSDGSAIDPTGEMPDGTQLAGLPDLAQFVGKDDRFSNCTAEKLFTYALGRAPTAADATHLTNLEQAWHAQTPTFSNLVRQLVLSVPFTQRQTPVQE